MMEPGWIDTDFLSSFCRTLSQGRQGQVRSPADRIPEGNVSCLVFTVAVLMIYLFILICLLDSVLCVCRCFPILPSEKKCRGDALSTAATVFSVTPRREQPWFWLAAPPVKPPFSSRSAGEALISADVSSVWMHLPPPGRTMCMSLDGSSISLHPHDFVCLFCDFVCLRFVTRPLTLCRLFFLFCFVSSMSLSSACTLRLTWSALASSSQRTLCWPCR